MIIIHHIWVEEHLEFSCIEKCVNDWIKYRSTDFNKFCFFNLSEKFVEKQKLYSLFLSSEHEYFLIFTSQERKVHALNIAWTPTHGRAKAGRPVRTYIQQLCEDTGCCPEDLLRAMNDREEWRERIRDIRATSATWWWWWWNLVNIFCACVKDLCMSMPPCKGESILMREYVSRCGENIWSEGKVEMIIRAGLNK